MKPRLAQEEIDEILRRPMLYLADEGGAEVSAPPIAAVVYVARSLALVKIGFTCMLRTRLQGLRNNGAAAVELLFTQEYSDYFQAKEAEQTMHVKFAAFRHHGEWFSLTEEQIQELKAALEPQTVASTV